MILPFMPEGAHVVLLNYMTQERGKRMASAAAAEEADGANGAAEAEGADGANGAEGRRVTEAGGERGHTRRHGHGGHKKQKGHKGQKQGARPLVHDKVVGTGPAA